jgi:hypothetical protein
MRIVSNTWLAISLFSICLGQALTAQAVVITNGGPGGVGKVDGTSTLQLWVKADSIAPADIIAGEVNVWTNRSGTAFTPTATSPTSRPNLVTNVLNGLPVVRFNGTSDGIDTSAFAGSVDRTLFVVSADSNQSTWRPVVMQSSNGGISYGWVTVNNFNKIYNVEDNVALEALSVSTFSPNQLVQSTSRWTASGNRLSINGALDATDADAVAGTAAQTLQLGHRGTQYFVGDIAEVAIFNSALNFAAQNIVENALSAKYNYAMTSPGTNDHYFGDTLGYDFDVFGIGRVDASNIHSSGGTVGFGFEATAGLGDGEWLLAGHNTVANTIVAYETTNSQTIGDRWNRVLYVDKTGTLDATISFNFNDAQLTLPSPGSTFHLLYSADGDFSDGWVELAQTNTITGGLVSFGVLNASLLDGYYTLGLNIHTPAPEPSSMLLLTGVLGCAVLRRRRSRRVVTG